MRTLVLVDGEHYPPVVADTIATVAQHIPHATIVGAALLGGTEKLRSDGPPDYGVPLVVAATPEDALLEGLRRFDPELVLDLADEPVLDGPTRLRLAAIALLGGAGYRGSDFRFDPPPRPEVATKPSVAVIGTGKRSGKTAVTAGIARLLVEDGTPPVVVAMGRGGPAEPELIDPSSFDLSPAGLLALSATGRHAASDHIEDALMARVATVGTRRCGGGMAGAPFESSFEAGVRLANTRPEPLLLFEGSGQAIPPVRADATVCVVPATADPALVTGSLGAYRWLLSDAVVITMNDAPLARSGMVAALEEAIRGLAPGIGVVRTTFRPTPLSPIAGAQIFYATTAPPEVSHLLKEHLEREHDCKVVGVSHALANRPQLRHDLGALEGADVLVVELKAASIDLAASLAAERGVDVVFCDNRIVSIGGDGSFEDLARSTTDLAIERFHHPRTV